MLLKEMPHHGSTVYASAMIGDITANVGRSLEPALNAATHDAVQAKLPGPTPEFWQSRFKGKS